MPMLIDGQWTQENKGLWSKDGRFRRKESVFRNWVTHDGVAGLSGRADFPASSGRYHLYVADACPWAHRTLIVRALKGLEQVISVSCVDSLMLEDGWTFGQECGATRDPHYHKARLYELYQVADPAVTSRVTVPVLWDLETRTIVNNESSEIIRMLNSEFQALGATDIDLYPAESRPAIDTVNARVYRDVNNGVYRTGFAKTQAAYEESRAALFDTLDWLEASLDGKQWLVDERLTEADIRLFVTLIRFDAVYFKHFKCNRNRIEDMPNLFAHTKRVYRYPKVAETLNLEAVRAHYYRSHRSLNPSGVVPPAPEFRY